MTIQKRHERRVTDQELRELRNLLDEILYRGPGLNTKDTDVLTVAIPRSALYNMANALIDKEEEVEFIEAKRIERNETVDQLASHLAIQAAGNPNFKPAELRLQTQVPLHRWARDEAERILSNDLPANTFMVKGLDSERLHEFDAEMQQLVDKYQQK